MTRVYIIFKSAKTCIRIYTDLNKTALNKAVDEAMAAKKSLFLNVYAPNGNGFKRSHVTATPYEILKDCVFHPEAVVLCEEGDLCGSLLAQARELKDLLNENGIAQVADKP